jgi:hypothetical protein
LDAAADRLTNRSLALWKVLSVSYDTTGQEGLSTAGEGSNLAANVLLLVTFSDFSRSLFESSRISLRMSSSFLISGCWFDSSLICRSADKARLLYCGQACVDISPCGKALAGNLEDFSLRRFTLFR